MLNIVKTIEADKARFKLEGRLDTLSAPTLERELEPVLSQLTELEIDLEKLEYVSSAGLRVLLDVVHAMDGQGTMKVTHVGAYAMSIFTMTGLDDILNIEP